MLELLPCPLALAGLPELDDEVLAQLAELFGDAAADSAGLEIADWRAEPYTSPPGVDALGAYGVAIDADLFWHHYARDAFGGVIMSVVASQIVGSSERSEAMFAAMAVRHTRHALDLGAESLV